MSQQISKNDRTWNNSAAIKKRATAIATHSPALYYLCQPWITTHMLYFLKNSLMINLNLCVLSQVVIFVSRLCQVLFYKRLILIHCIKSHGFLSIVIPEHSFLWMACVHVCVCAYVCMCVCARPCVNLLHSIWIITPYSFSQGLH